MKPILKWVGGKGRMLGTIKSLMPSTFNKYHEPFIGDGALFFSTQPNNAIISDANWHLINFYKSITNNLDIVLYFLESSELRNTEELYYQARKAFNSNNPYPEQNAALFYYLNRTCFYGLYRVNKAGQFNVPYGRYKTYKVNENALQNASKALQNTIIKHCSYIDIMPSKGDFIYLDPPYHSTFEAPTAFSSCLLFPRPKKSERKGKSHSA